MARYGNLSTLVFCGGDSNNSSSFWWRDILKMWTLTELDPIVSFCDFKVGNGFNTRFWEAKWFEDNILRDAYPNLYLEYSFKKVSVAEWGMVCGSGEIWVFPRSS